MRVSIFFQAIITTIAMIVLRLSAHAQVTLQPWTQVYGTVPGQSLGRYVTGNIQSPNLPYKAAISRFGNTEVYRLLTPTDTSIRQTFVGRDFKTGDLNGDGNMDLVVRRSGGASNMDTVMIYWGRATDIDTTAPTKLYGEIPQDQFGLSICIGNIIGDSVQDLIVGAPYYPGGNIVSGRLYIYRGQNPFPTQPTIVLNGDSARYTLGISCAIGDLNNDGYNDLSVRGWFQLGQGFDYVNIWFGGASFDTTRDLQLRSRQINSFGLACFDANGDSKSDLLWTNRDSLGAWVFVHYGRVGFSSVPSLKLRDPQFAVFGTSIVNGGDMNGDGYNDIVVAAPFSNNPGFIYVYSGGPRIDEYFDAAVGMSSLSEFGSSVSSVGDVTGDGLSDIIVGAPNYEFGNHRGYWGIFKGDSTIRVTDVRISQQLPSEIVLHQAYPNPFNPKTTIDYDVKQRAFVTLKVYNVLGQEVQTLVNKEQDAGQYSIEFDANGLSSGTYFYKIAVKTTAGRLVRETKKMLLLSEREKQDQDEYEKHLLVRGRAGDEAAYKELARSQREHSGGRLKRFLTFLDQKPDTILYLKNATVYFFDKDMSRLKGLLE